MRHLPPMQKRKGGAASVRDDWKGWASPPEVPGIECLVLGFVVRWFLSSPAKNGISESGLDNFGARYYSSSLGRFVTPDWAARPGLCLTRFSEILGCSPGINSARQICILPKTEAQHAYLCGRHWLPKELSQLTSP